MKLFLQNEPDEEASYHAEQVVVAACRPSRARNKKTIDQRRVDCRDIRHDMLRGPWPTKSPALFNEKSASIKRWTHVWRKVCEPGRWTLIPALRK
jgi:hypothetical protein